MGWCTIPSPTIVATYIVAGTVLHPYELTSLSNLIASLCFVAFVLYPYELTSLSNTYTGDNE